MKRLKGIIALCLCFIVGTCGVVDAHDWSKAMKKYGFSNVEELVDSPGNGACWRYTVGRENREEYAEWYGSLGCTLDYLVLYECDSTMSDEEAIKQLIKEVWGKRKYEDGTTTNYKKAFNLGLKVFKHNTNVVGKYFDEWEDETKPILEIDEKYGFVFEAFDYAYLVAYYKMMKGNYKLFNKLLDYTVITNDSDTDFSDYTLDYIAFTENQYTGEVKRLEIDEMYLNPYCAGSDYHHIGAKSSVTSVDYPGSMKSYAETFKNGTEAPCFLLSEGYLKNKGLLPADWSYPVSPDCDPEHAICKTFIYCPEVDNTHAEWLPCNKCIQVNISDGAKTLRRGYFTAVGSNVDALYADYIAISYGDASFSIEDESIATVDSNGTITPLSEGETTLTIHLDANGSYGEAERTVPLVIGR